MAEDIVVLLRADPAIAEAGIDFDLGSHDQRRDLVQVVRLLMELRVLVRVHGDEEQFLTQKGDSLYNINRPVLAAMLNVSRGPSTVEAEKLEARIVAIVEEPLPDTDEGRNRRLRSKLTRKMLDDPVLYYTELDADELAYLSSQRGHILRDIEHATGLIPEIRSEGIALVDERTDMTDLGLPEEGTNGHLALLLAEYLAEQIWHDERDQVGCAELYEYVAELIGEHRGHWRKDVAEPKRKRWQPIRGGLLNLYRFDHQEFHFEQGHLLLRGNNGTGKPRVLALQLPFLLDGDVSPARMEPDGDPARSASNGICCSASTAIGSATLGSNLDAGAKPVSCTI